MTTILIILLTAAFAISTAIAARAIVMAEKAYAELYTLRERVTIYVRRLQARGDDATAYDIIDLLFDQEEPHDAAK